MKTKRTRTKFTKEQKDLAMQMLANGYKVEDISKDLNVSKASLYNWKNTVSRVLTYEEAANKMSAGSVKSEKNEKPKALSIEEMDTLIREAAVWRDKASKSIEEPNNTFFNWLALIILSFYMLLGPIFLGFILYKVW